MANAEPPADLRRAALGVVMPGFIGTTVPAWLAEAVEQGLGGVALFGHNVTDEPQVRALSDELHRRGRVIVASDEEGGSVSRLDVRAGSRWPGAGALGALDDEAATTAIARSLGAQARRAGVDLVLAPVLDVGSEPDNPVIGVRSFGADPGLVARHGAAFCRGLTEAGVAACGKHFPGHGATRTDSHVGLPIIDVDEATWRARDLPPFRAAVAAGVPCLMTAHLVLTWCDSVPATVSARVLGLVRDELGYDGVIASDALDMRAIADRWGRGPAAVAALAAGVDLVCVGNPAFPDEYDDRAALEEVVGALVAAVADGSLPEERLLEASRRVATLAAIVADAADSAPASDQAAESTLGVEVARRSLRITGDVGVRGDAVVLTPPAALGMAAGERPSALVTELRRRRPDWEVAVPGDPAEAGALAREAAVRDRQVVLIVEGHDPQHALVSEVLATTPEAIVVHGGIQRAGDPGARTVHTHGTGAASAAATADVLLGGER